MNDFLSVFGDIALDDDDIAYDNIASELNAGTDVGLGLSMQESNDLVNFMKTLTDGFMQS